MDLAQEASKTKEPLSRVSTAEAQIIDLESANATAAQQGYNLCLHQHQGKWKKQEEKCKRDSENFTAEMAKKEKELRKREKAVERIEDEREKHKEVQRASAKAVERVVTAHTKTKDELATERAYKVGQSKEKRALIDHVASVS
jgi:hypothetical protein